jgi:1-phosphatidylinositol-4-phosphate 5-kinase
MDNNSKYKNSLAIKVTSYAHRIFKSIRKINNIHNEVLEKSLDLERNFVNILKAKESLGASGSFFFFSFDNKLIIKTIAEE